MLGLCKRGNVYHYDFCFRGVRYRGSTKADNKDLAKVIAKKAYEDVLANRVGISKPETGCSEFIESYLQERGNVCGEWSYTSRKLLEKFVRFLDEKGVKAIDCITTPILEEYKNILLESMVPVSAKNNFRVISAMLNHAVKRKAIGENPARSMSPIRGVERNKQRFLSKEEIELVVRASQKTFLGDLVLVALHTGMRRSELVFLEYEDIDLQNKIVYVKNKAGLGFQTKSRRERAIPIHDRILPILSRKIAGHCFTQNKERLSPRQATEAFTKLTRSIGLEGVGLHTLRHTFASHLAMSGVSLWEIAKLLGHSTTHVTEMYSHLCPNRREIEKLNF